ncbi:unnamed protein product [Arctogadus glacialis]
MIMRNGIQHVDPSPEQGDPSPGPSLSITLGSLRRGRDPGEGSTSPGSLPLLPLGRVTPLLTRVPPSPNPGRVTPPLVPSLS